MIYKQIYLVFPCVLLTCCRNCHTISKRFTDDEKLHYRDKVLSMFYHGYDNYINYGANFDELQPISCGGTDTWGSFSLTLIDSLDTLAIIGNYTEFKRVHDHIVHNLHFDHNINVSVFETNIRVVAGLLSAHLLSRKAGLKVDESWPCDGKLLRLAHSLAIKLLPAFDTETGMPYGTVNLMHGIPLNETPVTCTAGVGTFILEFGTLSRLTGDRRFEEVAMRAISSLHRTRSKLDLLGNHINTTNGKWIAAESSIGGGIDSYLEYLVKGASLFQNPQLMNIFQSYFDAISRHMKTGDWYFVVSMINGHTVMPIFQSLEAFWPGLLALIGKIDQAQKSLYNYHHVSKQYGFLPEFYDVPNYVVKRNGYPLRPEFVESIFYLYKSTKDPHLLHIAADVIEAIEHSAKTECGYATIKNVKDHTIEDRMESFFLAETLKYLYLIFNEDSFVYEDGSTGTILKHKKGTCVIDTGGYIFNTEAHILDSALIDCCYSQDAYIWNLENNVNLYSVIDLNGRHSGPDKKSPKTYNKEKVSKTIELLKETKITLNREIEKTRSKYDEFVFTVPIQPSTSSNVEISQLGIEKTEDIPLFDSSTNVGLDYIHNIKSTRAERFQTEPSTTRAFSFEQFKSTTKETVTKTENIYNTHTLMNFIELLSGYINNKFEENDINVKSSKILSNYTNERISNIEFDSKDFSFLSCPSQHFLVQFCNSGQVLMRDDGI